MTRETGATPYSRNVITAPSTVPWLLVASATAIMTVTYIQPIRTRYIARESSVPVSLTKDGFAIL
jgi:hypothetical protein